MVVISCEVELRHAHVFSLKEKRSMLKSMLEKMRRNFNVSIIEMDFHDDLKWTKLGFVVCANHHVDGSAIINKIMLYIEGHYAVEIIDIFCERR